MGIDECPPPWWRTDIPVLPCGETVGCGCRCVHDLGGPGRPRGGTIAPSSARVSALRAVPTVWRSTIPAAHGRGEQGEPAAPTLIADQPKRIGQKSFIVRLLFWPCASLLRS